jgi:anti-anti-sigma regulatory factor
MMDFRVQRPGELGILVFEGDLTVERSDELKCALMQSINCVNHVVFDLDGVTEVDLPCLRLFCSAHRIASALSKRTTLFGRCPRAFKKTVADAGYCGHRGCIMENGESGDSCLYLDSGMVR